MANPKRRAQIAEAAMQLFDERGYHATGMASCLRLALDGDCARRH